MSVYQSVYWRMPVLAQKLMGIWPYDDGTIYNKIMPICIAFALYCLMIPMGIRMVNELGVNNLIALENFLGEMYLHGALIKLTVPIIYKKELKAVYDLIANDWKKTLDKEELKIMEDHASLGRKISIFYIIACLLTAGCFIFIPICKPFLNYIIPLENGTRPWLLPYYVEYYIDQEKYFIPLLVQGIFSGLWSITVFITYDMSFAMCVQHVCSLFDIIRLRLYRASECSRDPSASSNYTHADRKVFKNIIEAMELHKIIIENVNILEDAYNICWFFILLLNTVGLGGVLVVLRSSLYTHLINVHYSYSCEWFQMSPRCKILIKVMMLRGHSPLELTGGKMFVLCMATYAAMLKAGMSYFTMLANTR